MHAVGRFHLCRLLCRSFVAMIPLDSAQIAEYAHKSHSLCGAYLSGWLYRTAIAVFILRRARRPVFAIIRISLRPRVHAFV